MGEMADYFLRMKNLSDNFKDFYRLASNFWRYRAAVKENKEAEKWIDTWKKGASSKKKAKAAEEPIRRKAKKRRGRPRKEVTEPEQKADASGSSR